MIGPQFRSRIPDGLRLGRRLSSLPFFLFLGVSLGFGAQPVSFAPLGFA
jgi:hypothetical protein